jgi:hypothetical protein
MSKGFSRFWRANGDLIAGDPDQWEFRSRILFTGGQVCHERHTRAADALASGVAHEEFSRDLPLGTVANYLAAQSLEVLLKAVALQRQPNSHLSGAIYNHDLAYIARDVAQIPLTGEEVRVLERARHLVEWAGRYPTPRWDAEKGRQLFDVPEKFDENGGEIIDGSHFPWSISWADLESVISKVHEIYLANRARTSHPP